MCASIWIINKLMSLLKVLRQGEFVKKMHNFGWTRPGYFARFDDELALHHALARYHA